MGDDNPFMERTSKTESVRSPLKQLEVLPARSVALDTEEPKDVATPPPVYDLKEIDTPEMGSFMMGLTSFLSRFPLTDGFVVNKFRNDVGITKL